MHVALAGNNQPTPSQQGRDTGNNLGVSLLKLQR